MRVRSRMLAMSPERRVKYQKRLTKLRLYEDPEKAEQKKEVFTRLLDGRLSLRDNTIAKKSDRGNFAYASIPDSPVLKDSTRPGYVLAKNYSASQREPFSEQGMVDRVPSITNSKHYDWARRDRVIAKVNSIKDPQRKEKFVKLLEPLREYRGPREEFKRSFEELMTQDDITKFQDTPSQSRRKNAFYNPASNDKIPEGMSKLPTEMPSLVPNSKNPFLSKSLQMRLPFARDEFNALRTFTYPTNKGSQ